MIYEPAELEALFLNTLRRFTVSGLVFFLDISPAKVTREDFRFVTIKTGVDSHTQKREGNVVSHLTGILPANTYSHYPFEVNIPTRHSGSMVATVVLPNLQDGFSSLFHDTMAFSGWIATLVLSIEPVDTFRHLMRSGAGYRAWELTPIAGDANSHQITLNLGYPDMLNDDAVGLTQTAVLQPGIF